MTKRRQSAESVFRLSSVLFIDLMASTFAVIILLTIVGAVRQRHEKVKNDAAQDANAHREPVKARDLRIRGGSASLGTQEEKYRHKCGTIDLYEDRIEISTNDYLVNKNTIFPNEFHDSAYKLAPLIKKCNVDKKRYKFNYIYLKIYNNNNFYYLIKIFTSQNIAPWWDFMAPDVITTTANEEATIHGGDINMPSAETSALRKKLTQQLADAHPNSNYEPGSDDSYDPFWTLLTEWIYQPDGGTAVQFKTHRKELLFTQEDVAKLFAALNRQYDAFRIDGPLSLLFLLALALLLFLWELGVTRGENKL